jgi:Fe-Mn family superoxide dismutase
MIAGIAGAQNVSTSTPEVRGSMAGGREPKPLPFDAAKLNGLSEKLIRSHWENNYIGSVKTLNMISERLAAAMKEPDLPPIVYGGLKREELHRVGSVILHEHYFGNLGADGKPAGDVLNAIKKAYGSYEAWDAEFRRTAMSLAGGSVWCVLTFNTLTNELRNQWAWDHMHGAIGGIPLLALDMYEHSYHMDYGTAAAKYIEAFMKNVNWEEVDRRFTKRAGAV